MAAPREFSSPNQRLNMENSYRWHVEAVDIKRNVNLASDMHFPNSLLFREQVIQFSDMSSSRHSKIWKRNNRISSKDVLFCAPSKEQVPLIKIQMALLIASARRSYFGSVFMRSPNKRKFREHFIQLFKWKISSRNERVKCDVRIRLREPRGKTEKSFSRSSVIKWIGIISLFYWGECKFRSEKGNQIEVVAARGFAFD